MVNATLSLKQLEWKANLYAINLSVPFNAFCCHVWSYVNLPFGHCSQQNKVFYYLFSLWNCLGSWLCCKNFSPLFLVGS